MKLKFIGRGSAFNVAEGNNSAYYLNNLNQLLLIDCGESVFATIKQNNLFSNVKEIFVAITHTHSDHFGSLGSLALFAFFALKQKLNIILTGNKKQDNLIKFLLQNTGVTDNYVNYITCENFTEKMVDFKTFNFYLTDHVQEIDAFCIVYETADGVTYYSADTNSTELLEKYLKVENLDRIYMDTCLADYEGNVHVSLRRLLEVVPKELRHKVYAMHLDNAQLFEKLAEHGFMVAEKE